MPTSRSAIQKRPRLLKGQRSTPSRAMRSQKGFEEWGSVFDPIVSRLATVLPGKQEDFCRGLCEELYRCLVVKARSRAPMSLSMPPLVDLAWHEAILSTERYMKFCEEELGNFIHHSTDTASDAEEQKKERREKMKEAYELVWGVEPPSRYWVETYFVDSGDGLFGMESEGEGSKATKSGVESSDEIDLYVRDAERISIQFRVKRDMKFSKIEKAYCTRMGVSVGAYRFYTNGFAIFGSQTPEMLGLRSGDVVDCHISQLGC